MQSQSKPTTRIIPSSHVLLEADCNCKKDLRLYLRNLGSPQSRMRGDGHGCKADYSRRIYFPHASDVFSL